MSAGRVLLVGGGGFLGTNLTQELLAAGREVDNLSRSWLHRLADPRVTYLPAESDSAAQLALLAARADCVFHMAHGSSPASGLDRMESNLATSMQLTFALIRTCAAAGVPLIYLSSGGAIYGAEVAQPTPETAPTLPMSAYGVEKLTAERYLEIAAQRLGLDYRVLRISNPYGPWQLGHHGQGVIGTWMRRALAGEAIEIWGDGQVVRDYVYVGDVVAAMLQAADYQGAARTFNIGSGEGRSLNDILGQLQSMCDRPITVRYQLGRPAGVPVSVLDATLAARELGWRAATGLEAGLARTWEWNRTQVSAEEGGAA